jgi:hypothetical protein
VPIVWVVRVGTTEMNVPRKRDAVVWLRQRSHDTRQRPTMVRECRGAYTFYGPGRDEHVMRASVTRVHLPTIRTRRRALASGPALRFDA